MKTRFNRFAIIPFECDECYRFVWLEKYRKMEVSTKMIAPCMPSSVTEKICNECLKKFNIGGEE